jgi:hypothetical protein
MFCVIIEHYIEEIMSKQFVYEDDVNYFVQLIKDRNLFLHAIFCQIWLRRQKAKNISNLLVNKTIKMKDSWSSVKDEWMRWMDGDAFFIDLNNN